MNKSFLFVFLLFLSSVTLFAFGSKEKDTPKEETPKEEAPVNVVKITGVVRLVGTAHFPEIVISNDEGDWFVVKKEAGKLHELQQRMVTLEAEESVFEMTFANGMSAGIRRELRNIKVISAD